MNINNNLISRPIQFSISFKSKHQRYSGYEACLGLSDSEKNGISKILIITILKVSEALNVSYRLKESSPFDLKENSSFGREENSNRESFGWHKNVAIQQQKVASCFLRPISKQIGEEDNLEITISTIAGEEIMKLSYDLIRASHQFASKNDSTLSITLPNKEKQTARNPYFRDITDNRQENYFLKNFLIHFPPTPSNLEQREIAMILANLDSSSTDEDECQQPLIPRRQDFIAPSTTSSSDPGRTGSIAPFPGPVRTVWRVSRIEREPYRAPSRITLSNIESNHLRPRKTVPPSWVTSFLDPTIALRSRNESYQLNHNKP